MMFKGMIVIYVAVLTVAAAKDAKAFSLFNVVTFQNDACTSTSITTNSGARIGQCFTAEECTAKGGTASGGCAMGFGTCCLFTQSTCGGTVDNNCTHIQNDGFPTVITNTNGGDTPVVCGQNDGQHMYIDIGPSETASATIGFTFLALAATRSWEIKVTQLECGNP